MQARRWLAPAVYAALALAVAGPLLAPGYVFALDHAMGPRSADFYATYLARNEDAIQSKGAYALLLLALDALMPAWAAQKLLLFVPFFLAGWGAHRLAQRHASLGAAFFGGILYAASPFAYLRGVSGQLGVLWAYALAPWFLAAWLAHVETRSRRALAAAVLLVAATAAFQAHGVAILALLVALHTLVRLARAAWGREPGRLRRAWAAARPAAALAAWSLAVNLAWLVPVALAPRTTLEGISQADRAFFATTSAGLPSVGLAAITLQGFWRDAYASPYPHPALLAIPALVLLLAARGLHGRRDDAGPALALAGALGLALAVGTSSPWSAWLFDFAWDRVPGMRGFRDAHKLLALLALAYAYLAPAGLDALAASLRATRARAAAPVAIALVALLPLAGATPLLGGYGGQLQVADYPEGWREVEEATRACEGAMLVLPWHLYLDLRFVPQADQRVTNPAKLYFTCPTITSDNLELGAAASQASTPQIAYADHWMTKARFASGNPGNITTLGNLLAPVGVRYVTLLKESDWRTLAPALDAQADLRLVLDNADARVYENLAAGPPRVRVERVVPIATLDELLPLSATMPFASAAFPLEGAPDAGAPLLLAIPPPRTPLASWRAHGEPPAFLSLGFAPVFATENAEGVTDSALLRVAAPAWSTSALSLAALLVWTFRADLGFIRERQ